MKRIYLEIILALIFVSLTGTVLWFALDSQKSNSEVKKGFLNNGFESGDLSNWIVINNLNRYPLTVTKPHNGNYSILFQSSPYPFGSVVQKHSCDPPKMIGFWLYKEENGVGNNRFKVGNVSEDFIAVDVNSIPSKEWVQYSFPCKGNTDYYFYLGSYTDQGQVYGTDIYLDDVQVI
jgi:hypothetical protein